MNTNLIYSVHFHHWLDIVFALLTIVLLGFYVFIWRKLAVYKADEKRFEKLPFLSVLICAKNEAENLAQFLPKIIQQRYPSFEVIVVNDGSTDATSKVLADFQIQYGDVLKVFDFDLPKTSSGKKQVLEFAISKAQSDYLVMTDADCQPNSAFWLVGMANGFANGSELVLGTGWYEKQKGWLNHLIQIDTLFIAINYLSFSMSGFPYMSVGRNVAYEKQLFERVGGFKSHYDVNSGDDDLFINSLPRDIKIGYAIANNTATTSVAKTTFKSFLNQKTRHVSAGMKYTKVNLLLLSLYYGSTTVWYSVLPFAIYYSHDLLLLSTMIVLKKLVMYAIVRGIFSKIGVRVNFTSAILMDLLSIIPHNTTVLINLLKSNKGKW